MTNILVVAQWIRETSQAHGDMAMEAAERQAARNALTGGLSLQQMVDGLRGRRYRDIVVEMLRGTGPQSLAGIALHRDLVAPEESRRVQQVLTRVADQAMDPTFWSVDAGDFLITLWHELNDSDGIAPAPVDDAGVYNLFHLVTGTLADKARTDRRFHRILLSRSGGSGGRAGPWSGATKALSDAIRDCGTGRISEHQLFSIFQEAVDNGDILLESNRCYMVPVILPLVGAGVLHSSRHLRRFESQTGVAISGGPLVGDTTSFAARRRPRWWRRR